MCTTTTTTTTAGDLRDVVVVEGPVHRIDVGRTQRPEVEYDGHRRNGRIRNTRGLAREIKTQLFPGATAGVIGVQSAPTARITRFLELEADCDSARRPYFHFVCFAVCEIYRVSEVDFRAAENLIRKLLHLRDAVAGIDAACVRIVDHCRCAAIEIHNHCRRAEDFEIDVVAESRRDRW